MAITSFTNLEVWQKARTLTCDVYEITKGFPKSEFNKLTDQLRRAVISISSNISEGFGRNHVGEKLRFYYFAKGSLTELQNQLISAHDLNYMDSDTFQKTFAKSTSIHMMLNKLISKARQFK